MTARPGFPAVSGAATFQDIRKALLGQFAQSAAGALRTGVLPAGTGPLITATASWVFNIASCVFVLDRGGVVLMANDGVAPVTISSAPTSGSRFSVLYAKQRETDAPTSPDPVNGPLIDKVEATTLTAARALLPVGAVEIGYVQVPAGAANGQASGVVITETIPYTAMEGGTVLVRNQTELDAWAPHVGSTAVRLDDGGTYRRIRVDNTDMWRRMNGVATYTFQANGVPDATAISTNSTVARVDAETTDTSIVKSNNGMQFTLPPGLYRVDFLARVNATITGRTFADISVNTENTPRARNNGQNGDDTVSVSTTVYLAAEGTITCRAFKTSSGTPNMTGRVVLTRME